VRLETHFGGEDAGALGPSLEPARAVTVLVAIIIGELHGEFAGLGDLRGVELPGPERGAHIGADDPLQMHGLVRKREFLRGEGQMLLGGFPDAGGVDGVEAERAGEVLGEGAVGANRQGEFQGDGLTGRGGAGGGFRGGLGAGLAGHDFNLSLRP
jgi:hypothetical protein